MMKHQRPYLHFQTNGHKTLQYNLMQCKQNKSKISGQNQSKIEELLWWKWVVEIFIELQSFVVHLFQIDSIRRFYAYSFTLYQSILRSFVLIDVDMEIRSSTFHHGLCCFAWLEFSLTNQTVKVSRSKIYICPQSVQRDSTVQVRVKSPSKGTIAVGLVYAQVGSFFYVTFHLSKLTTLNKPMRVIFTCKIFLIFVSPIVAAWLLYDHIQLF